MLEVIRQDYLRTARAKGVSERHVINKHALKNALIPIITILGSTFGNALGGAVVIETVFSWPGVARLTVTAINTRDMTLATGCIIMFTIFLNLTLLLVDIGYAYVDPRIKAQYSK
jgi:peptide/nickel transport system permease protein